MNQGASLRRLPSITNEPVPMPVNNESINGGLRRERAHDGFDLVERVARDASRFNVILTERDADKQLEKREKYLMQLKLDTFSPTSEEAFEDWVDKAAQEVTRMRIGCQLFQEAWTAAARAGLAGRIRGIPWVESHEDLVDSVFRAIWPQSDSYVVKLKREIVNGHRCARVYEARTWIEDKVARYERLCRRNSCVVAITNVELLAVAISSLPQYLARDIQNAWIDCTWDELWARAERQERRLVEEHGEIPETLGIFAAKDVVMAQSKIAGGNPLLAGM